MQRKLAGYSETQLEVMQRRVNYYNRLRADFTPSAIATTLGSLPDKPHSAYYFDMRETARYFPAAYKFDKVFGDVIHVPTHPSFVKSRPIGGDNANSVLLKLNKVRHYSFVRDRKKFDAKLNKLVWRGKVKPHQHRFDLVEKWYRHPACDIGQSNKVSKGDDPAKTRPFLSVARQLEYKYVLSMEGNDVATNLKWIFSSNSLCLMRRPRYETWFMEGKLIPDHHYVLLRDDFSDIEDKIDYFNEHPDEAQEIVRNANRWVEQFKDQQSELAISLMVLQKYFNHSRQRSASVYALSEQPEVNSSL
ncbi:MAG: glycosyl transferase family 90 [Gammaproteobacteria bacterium]